MLSEFEYCTGTRREDERILGHEGEELRGWRRSPGWRGGSPRPGASCSPAVRSCAGGADAGSPRPRPRAAQASVRRSCRRGTARPRQPAKRRRAAERLGDTRDAHVVLDIWRKIRADLGHTCRMHRSSRVTLHDDDGPGGPPGIATSSRGGLVQHLLAVELVVVRRRLAARRQDGCHQRHAGGYEVELVGECSWRSMIVTSAIPAWYPSAGRCRGGGRCESDVRCRCSVQRFSTRASAAPGSVVEPPRGLWSRASSRRRVGRLSYCY